ncbi:hypothetical protein M9H77_03484 [Catharanthus roseus]|uniref:Uncharacterized protein n=1 Tax=Catharanthus roseus TaxID=4058 RepID=A0ACC0CBU8_CATRO|nr:hypothetical protein M9H77_03484 [Catharanthus roseus]
MAHAEYNNFFRRIRPKKPPPMCYYCNISGLVWRQCVKYVKYQQQRKVIIKHKLVDMNRFKKTWVVKKIIKALVAHLSLKKSTLSDWYLNNRCSCHMKKEELTRLCLLKRLLYRCCE